MVNCEAALDGAAGRGLSGWVPADYRVMAICRTRSQGQAEQKRRRSRSKFGLDEARSRALVSLHTNTADAVRAAAELRDAVLAHRERLARTGQESHDGVTLIYTEVWQGTPLSGR